MYSLLMGTVNVASAGSRPEDCAAVVRGIVRNGDPGYGSRCNR